MSTAYAALRRRIMIYHDHDDSRCDGRWVMDACAIVDNICIFINFSLQPAIHIPPTAFNIEH
eukprot:scaffold3453_cov256-Chaetoceros_neogracile.AAC.14